MAGVGFELKKLFTARTAVGHIKAYTYSAIVTAGPFLLLTGMMLGVQLLFHAHGVTEEEQNLFIAPVVYSFIFSQLFTSGFTMVLTRYLADCISTSFLRDITSSLFGMCALLVVPGGLLAAFFLKDSPIPFLSKSLSVIFFLELIIIWVESVYLSAVKRFKRLIGGFAAGVVMAIFSCAVLLQLNFLSPHASALLALCLGMSILVTTFFVHITSLFGQPGRGLLFGFLPYFEKHWKIFVGYLGYNSGLYLPNILIWFGPWGVVVADTYRFSPLYDGVTFFAFLSLLPLMTLFVVAAETRFYEKYAGYFEAITRRGNLQEIEDARHDLLYTLWFQLRQVVEFQFLFTLLFLAFGSALLSWANIPGNEINMFDVLLFAVFFTGVMQILYILLTYFDLQMAALRTGLAFGILNLAAGLFGLFIGGPDSYGFTFFIAAALTLVIAWVELSRFTSHMSYYVYCAQPIFYQPPHGPLTRFAQKISRGKIIDLLQLGPGEGRKYS